MNFLYMKVASTLSSNVRRFMLPLAVYQVSGSASYAAVTTSFDWLSKIITYSIISNKIDMAPRKIANLVILLGVLSALLLPVVKNINVILLCACAISVVSATTGIYLDKIVISSKGNDLFKINAKFHTIEQSIQLLAPVISAFLLSLDVFLSLLTLSILVIIQSLYIFMGCKALPDRMEIESSFKKMLHHFFECCDNLNFKCLMVFSVLLNATVGGIISLMPALLEGKYLLGFSAYGFCFTLSSIFVIIFIMGLQKNIIKINSCIKWLRLVLLCAMLLVFSMDVFLFALGFSLINVMVAFVSIYFRTVRMREINNDLYSGVSGIVTIFLLFPAALSSLIVAALTTKLSFLSVLVILFIVSSPIFFIKLVKDVNVNAY